MPLRCTEADNRSAGNMALVPYKKDEKYPPLIYEGQEVNTVCEEELEPPYEVQGENVRRTQ